MNKKNVIQRENNRVQIKGHSQGSLLGISLIRFRKRTLERLLNIGNKQAEDPRQQPSGMTTAFNYFPHGEAASSNAPSTWRERAECVSTGVRGSLSGFTLIELLVVVLIIGILAAIAVPQYQKAVKKASYTQALSITKHLAKAQQAYYLTNGTYADTFDQLDIQIPFTSRNCPAGKVDWGYTDCALVGDITVALTLQTSVRTGVRRGTYNGYEYLSNGLCGYGDCTNSKLLPSGLYCRDNVTPSSHCTGKLLITNHIRDWYSMP